MDVSLLVCVLVYVNLCLFVSMFLSIFVCMYPYMYACTSLAALICIDPFKKLIGYMCLTWQSSRFKKTA